MLRASEPASGSVIAKQLIFSPLMVDEVALLLLVVGGVEDVVGVPAEAERHERPAELYLHQRCLTAPSAIPPYSSGVCTPKNPAPLAFSRSARSSSRVSPRSPRARAPGRSSPAA